MVLNEACQTSSVAALPSEILCFEASSTTSSFVISYDCSEVCCMAMNSFVTVFIRRLL